MSRPRIGQVLHGMGVAGAEALVHRMVRALADEFEFSLYLLDHVGALGEDLAAGGVMVRLLGRKPGVDVGLARRLGSALRRDRVALVHAHQYTPWFYATLGAARGFSRPRVFFTEHGRHYPDFRRAKRVAMNKLLLPFTDGIVAVSAFVRDCLRDHEGLPERRMRVLYNGVDPERFDVAADRELLRREQGVGPDDPVVGTAARFAPVKDHATLLRAFREVKKSLPAAKLVLAGDGELRSALESRAEELGIRESVRFLGVRRDVPALLRTWDVFCLSSLSEGTSVTLLEAMAAGLPAVVTRVGGNPEIVEEGVTGHTAPRGDAQALGAALVRVLRDREAGERMGRAGRMRVRDRFTDARMIEEYRALYHGLLAGERT
jgi:sugar transferase (PEP-CTERM/EpsH1 system associated)